MINNLWKSFKYNELFEIKNGKRVIIDEIRNDNGKYNFVSAIDYNNGVFCKTDIIPNHKAKTIAVNYDGNGVAEAYYQDEDYWALDSVNVLYPKFEINIYIGLFLATLIRKEKYRFSYGRKWNSERMKNSEIRLPIDNFGNPNFKYMEDFIKNLDKDNLIFKNYKEAISKEKFSLDNKKFQYFEIQELFDLEKGKGPLVSEIEEIENGTNFITASEKNNGVSYKINYSPTHKGNTISIASNGSVGEAFYQEKPFCATGDLNILIPKFELNKYIATFIISIIRKEKYRFSYGRKWGLEKMKTSKIKLPVDSYGKPDFKFMEDFIKSLEYSKYL